MTREEKAMRVKVAGAIRGLQLRNELWMKYWVQRERAVDKAGWCVETRGAGFWTALRNLPFIPLSTKTSSNWTLRKILKVQGEVCISTRCLWPHLADGVTKYKAVEE